MTIFTDTVLAFCRRFWSALRSALRPALRTAFWILKIMIPVTLGVSILDYLGVIGWLSERLAPLFTLLGLPGKAGLVFITSIFANIYSAIAVMATLSFDLRSVTILAVMCLIAHNMVIESAIQRKTGGNLKLIVPLRIGTAFLAGLLLNTLLPEAVAGHPIFPEAPIDPTTWSEVFQVWWIVTLPLVVKMFFLIVGLNILQNILREFHVIDLLIYPLQPLMKVFGLPRSTSMLWIVANMIGLAYGGAILIDELQRGNIKLGDAQLLHTHISVSHSLLEDTFLFLTLGVGLWWLLLPRLLLAIVAVWIQRFYLAWRISRVGNLSPNS